MDLQTLAYVVGACFILCCISAIWTLFVYRLPQKNQREAFQDMQVVNDRAADVNLRMGQIIKQLGDLASKKPIVEIPTAMPFGRAEYQSESRYVPPPPMNGRPMVHVPEEVSSTVSSEDM